MSDGADLVVPFDFCGVTHTLTVDQARDAISQLERGIEALKVQCPTCRCRFLPGSNCPCCELTKPDEPFV